MTASPGTLKAHQAKAKPPGTPGSPQSSTNRQTRLNISWRTERTAERLKMAYKIKLAAIQGSTCRTEPEQIGCHDPPTLHQCCSRSVLRPFKRRFHIGRQIIGTADNQHHESKKSRCNGAYNSFFLYPGKDPRTNNNSTLIVPFEACLNSRLQ